MSSEDGGRLVVAELGRPHGIRGEVTARLFGVTPEELLALSGLTLRRPEEDGKPRRVRVLDVRPRKIGWIVRVDAARDRSAAESLRGSEILARRQDLPAREDGEWLVADLVGLAVETEDGEALGTLAEVMLLPANDVLVVRGEQGELLLPFLEDVLVRVDPGEGRMVVRVPPGLREVSAES
ncbi:MAG: 16S rRNA processing protein RimM [Gemmatimonadetes bacterium]|nr:16S rRNA processing protein RimM [Gemmatimonadota bacterium]